MSDAYVTLEAAKALAECGYPQSQAWMGYLKACPVLHFRLPSTNRFYGLSVTFACTHQYEVYQSSQWYAAPTSLQALDWLEKEKGWKWDRLMGKWYARHCSNSGAVVAKLETPNDLIIAIIEHLQKEQHDKP